MGSGSDERDMQAVILAGGAGTRLWPLTARVAKPVVTLVDRPFIVFMLDWLRGHGVSDVILCCGFGGDGVREVLGDGARYGIQLRYVAESEPLGTGGPLRLAQELLDERSVLELIAPARPVSIEREVWPALVGQGLYGYDASGYWLDIGTPERYLQGSFDIIAGAVHSDGGRRDGSAAIGVGSEVAAAA